MLANIKYHLDRLILSAVLAGLFIPAAFPEVHLPFFSLVVSALEMLDFIFHEAGHFLFQFGGAVVSILGGTLAQLLFPVVLLLVCLRRQRQILAAGFLFWYGLNFLNIGQYIADARRQSLPLISPMAIFTGSQPIHDWNYLLGRADLLWADQILGSGIYGLGILLLVAAVFLPVFPWLLFSPSPGLSIRLEEDRHR